MPPFTPKIGDLVIIKGGIVGRILRLQVTGQWRPRDDQRKGRVVLETWYPIEGWRLVPFAHILDRAGPGSRMSSARVRTTTAQDEADPPGAPSHTGHTSGFSTTGQRL